MPTVLRANGFRVMIYLAPREHGPAHVHVWREDAQIVITLGHGEELPTIIRNTGMRNADVISAYRLVQQHLAYLREQWSTYHD
jgi:hypothetical protein